MSTYSLQRKYPLTPYHCQTRFCDQAGMQSGPMCWIIFTALLLVGISGRAVGAEPDSILMGISRTLTRNIPPATLLAARPAVDGLMERSSGRPVTILDPRPSHELADRLASDRIQLGVFSGVEFAWQRTKHPELRPLAIVVNQHSGRQAVVLVRGDSQATNLDDLRGGIVALSRRSPEHCRLFLQAHCRAVGQQSKQLFSQVTEPATAEDALDDLVDGIVAGAVVDSTGLKAYARRKPGRFGKLKVLHTSQRFPDTVIAYHDGALDEAVIQRLRRGLSQADKTPEGRNTLLYWKATAFEVPTAEYDKLLVDIIKTNPDPGLAGQK